jgi:hypothetical protein
LTSTKVKPAAAFATPSVFVGIRRETDDTNYYFFFNPTTATPPVATDTGLPPVTSHVTLTGKARRICSTRGPGRSRLSPSTRASTRRT